MERNRLLPVLLGVLALLPSSSLRAAELVIAGQPRAVIVITADALAAELPSGKPRRGKAPARTPLQDVRLAADELREHLQKMSGADIEIVAAGSELGGRLPLYLDEAADAAVLDRVRALSSDPAAFALVVDDTAVSLRGLSAEGTLFGAYELLEQLGVRWLMPGEIGRVVPQRSDVVVASQETVQAPSFPARWAAGFVSKFKTWQRRLRMGGPYFPPAHGVHLPAGYDFETHPEYYALIAGERKKRQLCVSNPEVLKGAIETTRAYFKGNPGAPWIGLGPNDGRGFCECENCTALDGGDWDPFAATISMTDRYLWFFGQILDGIADEFPDKKICFYSYASYNRPPVKIEPNPRIVPAFAPITLCRIHGMGNPICPEKNVYYRWLVQEWGQILPEVYDRGYWFNLADPGFLFPMVHRLRTQIPLSHELGITGWRVECLGHWGSEFPSLYIAGKLMWNHAADVDALLADAYAAYFGPAAKPMAAYFTLLDAAVRDADFHTGSSYDVPKLYPATLRQQAHQLLDQATGLAGGGDYAKRVQMFREILQYTEAFIDMIELRNRHDWAGAGAALERLDALRETLTAYEIELASKRYGVSYLKRFFRPCTEEGYKRAVTDGSLLAGLADEWAFKEDPEKIGEALHWFSPEVTGGNWRTLRTSSLSWSDQDLRTYKGDGWYRQSVPLPAVAAERNVFLWCGGVDELATVWVNGQAFGDSPGRAFVPFEIDVSDAVRPGAENLVVMRVSNAKLNELGTGGITAPVFFWTPATAGHEADEGGTDVTPVEFK